VTVARNERVRRALVIGAGLAGLCAARVLADHVDEVLIVERDRLPVHPQPRNGTPQARHLHNLLLRGQHDFEVLFPGFGAELEAGGAVPTDLAHDMRFHSIWGWFPRYPSDLRSRLCSRLLVEHVIRERVRALPRVRWLEQQRVVELLGDARRVCGVRCERAGAAASERIDVEADLVVEASGRSTRLPRWLETLLGAPPLVIEVDPHMGYASRIYRTPHARPDWHLLLLRNPLPSTRSGGILPLEGGRWVATLVGFAGDHPPTDEAGFAAFARSLAVPDIANALDQAEPLSEPMGYRQTTNLWRHYEQLPRWPVGLAALGDAVCSLNPMYGQGMSVVAMEAVLLRKLLERHGATAVLGEELRRALAALLRTPWVMATSEDYRYAGTTGPKRSSALKLRHWMTDVIAHAAMLDTKVHYGWTRVVNLLDPPTALLRPALLARTAVAHLRPARRRLRSPDR
jgi:flavin-dependent dehydrogenase